MKLVITSNGDSMDSKFCPKFSECEYLIVYDTETKTYASRVSPAFESKDKEALKEFLKKIFMQDIITGEELYDEYFYVYIPENMDTTVRAVVMEALEGNS